MKALELTYQKYKDLPLQDVLDYDRYNQLLLIHSSSAMEGSTLTLSEAELLINEGITPKGKPLEHSLMVKDHYEALTYVRQMAKKTSLQFSETFLKEIGARVMRSTGSVLNTALGTVDSRAGGFRISSSRATGGSYYVDHSKIPHMIKELCENLNESINKISSISDVLTLSSYAHLQLLTIHPFVDGNGRSARLLQNAIMLKNNKPLIVIRHENKPEYIKAIKKSRAADDLKYFESFISKELENHLNHEIVQYEKMKKGKDTGMSFILNF